MNPGEDSLVDPVDFQNTLATFNLSAAMCRGFEEEAMGGMVGLIQFRYHTDAYRLGWDRACIKWANEAPGKPGGPLFSPHKTFFHSLMMVRNAAFGLGTSLADVNDESRLVVNPWSLTDPEFTRCLAYVRNKEDPRLPEYDKSLFADNAKYVTLVGGPAAKVIGRFLKKAAPELISGVGELTEAAFWPLLVGGLVVNALGMLGAKITHAQNIAHYKIDGTRREYLTKQGRGQFLFANSGGGLT